MRGCKHQQGQGTAARSSWLSLGAYKGLSLQDRGGGEGGDAEDQGYA